MRRYLAIIVVMFFILMAGCTLPISNTISPEDKTGVNEEVSKDNTMDSNTVGNIVEDMESIKDDKTWATASANVAMIPVTLYYQDADGYLIPMTRWIDKQPGIANAALSGLIDNAIIREELQYYGVYPVLPINTDVLGISIKDGTARVDFNKELLEYDNARTEKNIVASIVYTLTEFPTVNNVKITVNGYTVDKLKYGTDITSIIDRSNVSINSTITKGANKSEIYCFKKSNEGFTYLLPVSVESGSNKEIDVGEAVKLLLKGKTDEKLQNEIPAGVVLQKYAVSNGVLVLDFNSRFLEYGGNAREEAILKQLTYTVKKFNGVNLLKITIDGKKADLPEGTDISAGLAVPKTINDLIDR